MAEAMDIMEELKLLREELKGRLEIVSELELQLLTRKRRLMQNEIKVDCRVQHLEERELAVQERESCLLKLEESVHDFSELMEKNEAAAQRHKGVAEENRRLKDSFTTLCNTNLRLKKQLEDQEKKCSSLKKSVSNLRARLSSLQVGTSHSNVDLKSRNSSPEVKVGEGARLSQEDQGNLKSKATQTPHVLNVDHSLHTQSQVESSVVQEVLLSHLMQWVLHNHTLKSGWVLNEKFCGVFFPQLASVLHRVRPERHAVFLHFICWSLQHMNSDLKLVFSATLRRIGEVCARGKQNFVNSTDVHVRILSSLLVLQTLSQVDLLCLTLETLKKDLAMTEAQSLFLSLGGVKILLPYFLPDSKFQVMCLAVVDIFVLVSSDSALVHFLNKDWFSAAVNMLNNLKRNEVYEKLIILLQRLSAVRMSKELFEKYGITKRLQSSAFRTSPFAQLNIASIKRNLGN